MALQTCVPHISTLVNGGQLTRLAGVRTEGVRTPIDVRVIENVIRIFICNQNSHTYAYLFRKVHSSCLAGFISTPLNLLLGIIRPLIFTNHYTCKEPTCPYFLTTSRLPYPAIHCGRGSHFSFDSESPFSLLRGSEQATTRIFTNILFQTKL